jgi:hypothetical protein
VSYDGGIDVNARFEIILKQKYPEITFTDQILEEIKLNRARVRQAGQKYGASDVGTSGYEISYDLPDGNKIQMNNSDLSLPYEKVFKNNLRGEESDIFDMFFDHSGNH